MQSQMDVTYVAKLARLNLSTQEIERFESQLGQVLSHVEQMRELNVEGIEATAHASPRYNVFRSDEARSSLPVAEALKNAPRPQDDLFVVPKVVE